MNRAIVAFFTGTGNARRAAGIVYAELERSGRRAELLDLASDTPLPTLGGGDILVVCSSTLGFSLPSTALDRIKGSAKADGAKAAVLCVCGSMMSRGAIVRGWSGAASIVALSALGRLGYEGAGSADASYPENWTQVSRSPQGAEAAAMVAQGDQEARAFALALAENRGPFLRRNIATRSLMRLIGFVFRLAARRMLGRLYIADDACTSCGLCAASCPSKAIAMKDGSPSWTVRCSACNRCINACPASAIQTSIARLAAFVAVNIAAMIAVGPLAGALVHGVAPGLARLIADPLAFILGVAVYCAFTALQLGPLDALMQGLERTRGLRPLFTASFTKSFARYLAPGFKPGSGD